MTEVKQTVTYRRSAGVMWRDTGHHVLVLLAEATTDVKVLGGGGATVWRLLEGPRTVAQVHAELEAVIASPPPINDIEACIAKLAAEGLLGIGPAS